MGVDPNHRCYKNLPQDPAGCRNDLKEGGYREYARDFCIRRPKHTFCKCYNVMRMNGKFCEYAAFSEWPGCKEVEPKWKAMIAAVPESQRDQFKPSMKKCLGNVCTALEESIYVPDGAEVGCRDINICSMDIDLNNVSESDIAANCNINSNRDEEKEKEVNELLEKLREQYEKGQSLKDGEKKNGFLTPLLSVSSVALIVTGIVLFMKGRPKSNTTL